MTADEWAAAAAATDEVAEAIHMLAHRGRLTPDAIIEAARQPANPLHEHFPWDDAVAAHHFRREIARKLIGRIHVVVTVEHTTLSVPYYVRDSGART